MTAVGVTAVIAAATTAAGQINVHWHVKGVSPFQCTRDWGFNTDGTSRTKRHYEFTVVSLLLWLRAGLLEGPGDKSRNQGIDVW